MAKKWVDSLFLGTWHLPSGDVFRCTPSTVKYFYNRTKELLGAQVPVPVCLEHQPSVGLSFHDKLAEQTKNTVGHIHDTRINPDGSLAFEVDGDESAHEIMRRNKTVSPEIRQNVIDTRTGRRFEGPSIVHLAITPNPVQRVGRPHVSLSAQQHADLEKASVNVSLSSAVLLSAEDAKDKKMPFPPKKDDDDPDDGAPAEIPVDDENLNDGLAGDDADDAPLAPSGEEAQVGAAIAELAGVFEPMGIMFHASSKDSALDMLQHVITAVKTHQATKGTSGADNLNQQDDPNKPDPNAPQEPETPETPPIMMSAANTTPRELKMAKAVVKTELRTARARIDAAYAQGWLNEKIRNAWMAEAGTVKLSMADFTDDGDLKPFALSIKLSAVEELMKTGKPGPFPRHGDSPKGKVNPLKPISSAISLSATEEEAVALPYEPEDDGQSTRADQEAIGREMAAMVGFAPKK